MKILQRIGVPYSVSVPSELARRLHSKPAVNADAINHISFLIIQSAIEIHRVVGPGLLERAYRACMIYELRERGLTVESERIVPVQYKALVLDSAYRIDLLVQDEIIVELKSVEVVLPVHQAQVLSYLRLTNKRLGLLINFNVPRLVDGVTRIANKFGCASARSRYED